MHGAEKLPGVLLRKDEMLRSIRSRTGQLGVSGWQKIAVSTLWENEAPLCATGWTPLDDHGRRPVLVTANLEIAVFDERAPQDRHYHGRATETYTVLDGEMSIDLRGDPHTLRAGDTIIVLPGNTHEVLRDSAFVCLVVISNCGGPGDKYLVDSVTGLCATCRYQRVIRSDRGSVFHQCQRSASDSRYPKYPRLPVETCDGHEPQNQ
jgi:mannose-6-phosphate isomerase-like protein (cupin superfamily)